MTVASKWSFALFSLVLIFLAEMFYRQPLFNYSLTFIKQIQAGASPGQATLWHAYSNVGLYSIQGVPLVISFVIPSERTRCAYYFAVFLVLMVFQNITKLAYHDPRPFWVSQDVQALSCSS